MIRQKIELNFDKTKENETDLCTTSHLLLLTLNPMKRSHFLS